MEPSFDRHIYGLFRAGAVSRNKRFHEAEVEILQSIAWRLTQATGTSLELGPDISKPDRAEHPEFRTQLRGWTAWMHFQEIFHVLSYDRRQFFDLEEYHIQETHTPSNLDCPSARRRSER